MATVNDPAVLKNGPLEVVIQGLGNTSDPSLHHLCLQTLVNM